MMKKIVCVIKIVLLSMVATYAQQYPMEFKEFMGANYIYNVQTEVNTQRIAEATFNEYLIELAYAGLARQIEVQIKDSAIMHSESINNDTKSSYSSTSTYLTDVRLKLVISKSVYDHTTHTGYAIAYINKAEAQKVYIRDIKRIMNNVNNAISTARSYIDSGYKTYAENELKSINHVFVDIEDALFALTYFGTNASEVQKLHEQCNRLEQTIKEMFIELKHSSRIYIRSSADLFGQPYRTIGNEIMGVLSAKGCSFVNSAKSADWVVDVKCKAREVTQSNNIYTTFVDATITITKCYTQQVVFSDVIIQKGSSSANYYESAHNGYKKMSNHIARIIEDNINL